MIRRLIPVALGVLSVGCASAPPPPYDASKLMAEPCEYVVFSEDGHFYAAPVRESGKPGFAQGAFGAAMRVWVTYAGNRTELVTINARPTDVKVRITGIDEVIGVSTEDALCQAFAA
jgi:hypothetical protein